MYTAVQIFKTNIVKRNTPKPSVCMGKIGLNGINKSAHHLSGIL